MWDVREGNSERTYRWMMAGELLGNDREFIEAMKRTDAVAQPRRIQSQGAA